MSALTHDFSDWPSLTMCMVCGRIPVLEKHLLSLTLVPAVPWACLWGQATPSSRGQDAELLSSFLKTRLSWWIYTLETSISM